MLIICDSPSHYSRRGASSPASKFPPRRCLRGRGGRGDNLAAPRSSGLRPDFRISGRRRLPSESRASSGDEVLRQAPNGMSGATLFFPVFRCEAAPWLGRPPSQAHPDAEVAASRPVPSTSKALCSPLFPVRGHCVSQNKRGREQG